MIVVGGGYRDLWRDYEQSVMLSYVSAESRVPKEEHPLHLIQVMGTLMEAWAGLKSFMRKGDDHQPPTADPGNPSGDFHGGRRTNATHQSANCGRDPGLVSGYAGRRQGYELSSRIKKLRIESVTTCGKATKRRMIGSEPLRSSEVRQKSYKQCATET